MKKYRDPVLWQFSGLKYVVLGLVVLVPLYFNTLHLFPFETPKNLIVIMGAIIAGGLYLWGRARERESALVISWGHVALSLFITVVVISGLNAVVPRFSFFGAVEGRGILMLCGLAIIASMVGFLIKKDSKFVTTLMAWSVAVSPLVALFLYGGEKLLPNSSEASTLGNTSYTGAYLLINICFTVGLFILQKNPWKRLLVGSAGLILVTSPIIFNTDILKGLVSLGDIKTNPLLLLGDANGAAIGLGLALFAIGALFLVRSRKMIWQWVGAVALVGLFVGIYTAGQVFMNPDSSLHKAYVFDKSANRFLFWDISSEAAAERPLLGWGMNGYSYAFQEHFSSQFFSPGYIPELWTNNPHNMFKEYQVNTGILGLIGYLLLIGTTGVVLFIGSRSEDKIKKTISIVMFGALCGYVIQNLFVFDTVVPLLMFYIIIGYAIGVSGFKTITLSNRYRALRITMAAVISIFLLYAFIVAGIKPWKESVAWDSYTEKNMVPLIKSPQTISSIGTSAETAELADKLLDFLKKNVNYDTSSAEEKLYYFQTFEILANNLEKEIISDGRGNFRAHWTAGRLYIQMIAVNKKIDKDILEKTHTHMVEAIKINPTNPLTYYDMVQVLLFEKDKKAALSWTRASIALAPEYRGGYLLAQKVIDGGLADKNFVDYVSSMKDRWCQEDSLCSTGKWK